jgi:hypothetical protein
MEPECSLPHSQVPTTCSYASLIQSIPPHPTSWRSTLILSSHLRLGLPSGVSLRFPRQKAFPIRLTYPTHLIILDLITWTVLREEYRSYRKHLGEGMAQNLCYFKRRKRKTFPRFLPLADGKQNRCYKWMKIIYGEETKGNEREFIAWNIENKLVIGAGCEDCRPLCE